MNDLAVATNGRSFWVLDDLMPLRELNPQLAQAGLHLYKPQPAIRLHFPEQVERRRPVGQNPPIGAIIDYYFKSKPAGRSDARHSRQPGSKLVRHYSNKEKKIAEQPPEWPDQEKPKEVIPAESGMNRFPWDLRYEPPVKIPDAFYSDIGPLGPLALPGSYQVKLTADGQSRTQPLELRLDPRVTDVSAADLQKEFDLEHEDPRGQQPPAPCRQSDPPVAERAGDPAPMGRRQPASPAGRRRCQAVRPEDDPDRGRADPGEDEEFGGQSGVSQ